MFGKFWRKYQQTYLNLSFDGLGEAARPFQARVLLDDLLDHVLVHEVWLPAHVVCNPSQLMR
jgi:hypothetical protein